MSYLVLARKWRPQTFNDVVAQQHAIQALQNAIRLHRLPHALLLCGSRGIGKTTIARLVAKTINCEVNDPSDESTPAEPCNQCNMCQEITTGRSVDVIEIDGASNRSIDDIRELRDNVQYLPTQGRRKVYIIDEVHMLTREAFNALLKTLEEPPEHVLFTFATTEPHKIPITILSRCQRFDLKRISLSAMKDYLGHIAQQEGLQLSDTALMMITRAADGGMRDALSLMDQVIAFGGESPSDEDVAQAIGALDRTLLLDIGRALLQRDLSTVLRHVEDLFSYAYDIRQLTQELASLLRDMMVVSVVQHPAEVVDLAPNELQAVQELAANEAPERIQQMFRLLTTAAEEIAQASHPRLLLEMTLIQMARVEPVRPFDELLYQLQHLEERLLQHPSATGSLPPASTPNTPLGGTGGPAGSGGSSGFSAASGTSGFSAAAALATMTPSAPATSSFSAGGLQEQVSTPAPTPHVNGISSLQQHKPLSLSTPPATPQKDRPFGEISHKPETPQSEPAPQAEEAKTPEAPQQEPPQTPTPTQTPKPPKSPEAPQTQEPPRAHEGPKAPERTEAPKAPEPPTAPKPTPPKAPEAQQPATGPIAPTKSQTGPVAPPKEPVVPSKGPVVPSKGPVAPSSSGGPVAPAKAASASPTPGRLENPDTIKREAPTPPPIEDGVITELQPKHWRHLVEELKDEKRFLGGSLEAARYKLLGPGKLLLIYLPDQGLYFETVKSPETREQVEAFFARKGYPMTFELEMRGADGHEGLAQSVGEIRQQEKQAFLNALTQEALDHPRIKQIMRLAPGTELIEVTPLAPKPKKTKDS